MSFLGVGRCWFGLGGLSKRQLGQWRWWRWSCWQATEADGGAGRAEQVRVLIIIKSLVVVVLVVMKWLIRILDSPINNTNPMNEKDQEHHYGHHVPGYKQKILENSPGTQ